jgi:hypothetical protein
MLKKNALKIKKQNMPLINEHLVFKLQEILEFCEFYCGSESYEIQNLTQK